jgi:hypothetical protein
MTSDTARRQNPSYNYKMRMSFRVGETQFSTQVPSEARKIDNHW